MIKCGQAVITHVMNPKSMPRERLLGRMDLDTREWFDGVLTDAARKVVREPAEVSSWIICDGDVDPEWIESLNSVLDDNHLLTLPNGERISFGPNVNFLFETHDLKFASPATVSRMGMIFLSDDDLDRSRIVQRWLSMFSQELRLSMSAWVDELFYKALDNVLRIDGYILDTTLVGTIMNGLSQVKGAKSKQEFLCGLVRGLGGNLGMAEREVFARDLFSLAGERAPGALLDCYADVSSLMTFSPSRLSAADALDIHELGETIVVPTVAVQRTLATLESWILNMEPFILVGPEGCGKSMIIQHAFRQKRNMSIATLHCNAQTSADDIINKISQTCSLFSSAEGRVYRPRDCERLVLYLKDINLPRPDMYNTCQLIAFLQQLITFEGFYNEELEFLRLERVQIVASINAATTVGRHALSTRFTAVVRIFVVDYPDTSELVNVYDTFINAVVMSADLGDPKWKQPSERERLASGMVEVYQKVREKFTVDDRRHYLFTPRDVTAWVKNLCRYDLSAEPLLEVVAYEACRIFRDRLVGQEAVGRFDQLLSGIFRSGPLRHTITSLDATFSSLTAARGGGGMKTESKEDGVVSEVMGGRISRMSESDLSQLVAQGIMYYEREERELDMLLFPELLEHVAHVDRVLSSYGGHLLLVGRCGVGRRNAVTIVSYMLGYEVYSPTPAREYGPKQFCADVKVVMAAAGVRGEHVVLFVEDFQIVSENILELINSLLSSGEVSGLYSSDELEPLLGPLKERFREEGSFRTPYEFFVSRVRKYLHVALCMDPTHPSFLYRCESNPALYTQCSILWLGEWRTASLRTIPALMEGVKDLLKKEGGLSRKGEGKDDDSDDESKREGGERGDEVDSQLLELILSIHESSLEGGATPRDFLALMQAWKGLLGAKRVDLVRDLGHLEAGLHKLDSATEIVNDLSTNAGKQEKELKVAEAAANKALDEITKALSRSGDRKKEVIDIKAVVAENEKATRERKTAIEGELAEIQPVLDSAKEAVGMIKSDNLNEIRALKAPPEAIADVLAAVLTLLGMEDLTWQAMKTFLGNRGVKEEILHFDARGLSDDVRKKVMKILKAKANSFEPDVIRRVSVAAAPLAAWAKANVKYSLVIERIEPLQRELDTEEEKLKKSRRKLQECEDELLKLDERCEQLKAEYAARMSEAERLKRNLALAGTTLVKAQGLIGQLGGEQARWKVQAQSLREDVLRLPVKMLLAAGFSTYLAKTPEDTRSTMVARWTELAGLRSGFSFRRALSTESELLQWKIMGLPADDLSQGRNYPIFFS
jgi:dynein heavy chain 2